jgi:hypothetical protein
VVRAYVITNHALLERKLQGLDYLLLNHRSNNHHHHDDACLLFFVLLDPKKITAFRFAKDIIIIHISK